MTVEKIVPYVSMEINDTQNSIFTTLNRTNSINPIYNITEMNDTYNIDMSDWPPLLETGFRACIIPIIFSLIFVVGLVGNGALIHIVARDKNLRNTPNIFIVSLASGDLLLILTTIPFVATVFTFTYWPYGTVMCKLTEFMQTLSLGVSVFTLVALSGDRYVAIVYPMSKHKGSLTMRTGIITGGIWVFAALLAIMELVQTDLQEHVYNESRKAILICFVQSGDSEDVYARFRVMFRFCIYFAIPVLIITVFYTQMAQILIHSSKLMPGDSKNCSQAIRQFEARKKVAKVVLSFVVIFFICWLPYHIYYIWYYFLPGEFNHFWLFFKVLGFCMAFINSCVNPFALYFLSKQFRGYYNHHLFCWCAKKKHRQNGEYTTTLYQFNSAGGRTGNSFTMITSKSVC